MNPVAAVDRMISNVTMYKLLLYVLLLLVGGSIVLSVTGVLSLSASGIALDTVVLVPACYIANELLARLYHATTNVESWLLTALILVCILPPTTSLHGLFLVSLGGLLAMGSKYIITLYHKHLFNPAAFAAIVLGISGLLPAIWWVGSPVLEIPMLVMGIVILRKIRRFQLSICFGVAALIVTIIVGSMHQSTLSESIKGLLHSSPLFFLGTVMLTEPETTPPRIWQQRIYGVIVGALFTSQLRFGVVSATPEAALIVGNVYSYLVSPKHRLKLTLKSKRQLSPTIYDFGFASDYKLPFRPGQYLEWTLAGVPFDSRGNRRTFSIASGPDEEDIHIGIKTYEAGSTYKKTLTALEPGAEMTAGLLAGNFVLPDDQNVKLVFIAGGIGVTPFVSMVQDMISKKTKRDVVMFYLVSDPAEYVYQDVWKQAEAYGLKIIPLLTHEKAPETAWSGKTGRLTADMLKLEVSDYKDRRYYLSGPNALVAGYSTLLRQLKIRSLSIIKDHFSGY
jgi:ferredoxin-NADP reductase/Na+-translocating ferredoxin:NAD+ oxidoreductase RnfD subunit